MYDNTDLLNKYQEKKNKFPHGEIGKEENNCGDSVSFAVIDGKLTWDGYGCFITTVASELICDMYNNNQPITEFVLRDKISNNLPPKRKQCISVAISAYDKFNKKDHD